MEDYDRFVQHRLSNLKKNEAEKSNKPPATSSVIRFCGQPILPPLLTREKKEEMQQHRDAAQKAAAHRKLKFDTKMARVQNILESIQLRRTPTLEELLQESGIPHKGSDGSVSQSSYFTRSKDSLLLSSLPESNENNGASVPPLTSTTYSAFFSSDVTPQQSNQDRCLTNQQEPQPYFLGGVSHQSESSGYVTYENVENATSVSGGADAEKESRGFGSSEGACDVGGFFLHSTSNTIAKMPDIISHPPIDGEELEKSGLESSCCQDFVVMKDISCSSLQQDSMTCERFPGEKCESSRAESSEGGDYLSVSTVIGLDKDSSLDVNSVLSDSPESSHTQSVYHHPTAESYIQHEPTESADSHTDEAEPSVQPHRLSLQALLKRSQECRRRQRMLRNQAKNAKIQERTQAEARARTEERSLSDKENDELLPQSAGTSEGKKPGESRGIFVWTDKTPPKIPRENQRKIAPTFFMEKTNLKSESSHSARDGGGNVMEETTFESNKVNVSPDVETEPKIISASTQKMPKLTDTSPVQKPLCLTNSPTDFHTARKYNTIPVPSISRSPVCFKSTFQVSEAADGAETITNEDLIHNILNKDHTAEEVNIDHQSTPKAASLTVGRVLASSQHIDQLELNLSGLKAMISDLESTLAENLGRQNQAGSLQSEFSFEGSRLSEEVQSDLQTQQPLKEDCDSWQDSVGGGADSSSSERFIEGPRRQSLDDFRNIDGDTGAESGNCDTDNHPLMQVKVTKAVNLSELRLVKTLAAERAKEQTRHNKGLTKSQGQHGSCGTHQPTAKHILSEAQRLRIPEVFRVVLSETTAQCDLSVLSDSSDPPVEGRGESAVEGDDCTSLPSLNRSYEVESPSDLWLHEGSGSDVGTRACLGQENSLTPESGGEDKGGMSKVKRRLLMQVAEETTGDGNANSCRGETCEVRPNSSTSRGAVHLEEVPRHGDERKRLKQAYAAQLRALKDEHRRQQEELWQVLAVRYRLLHSVSFPCSVSSSRLGDTLTFPTTSQPSVALSERYRPLLLAVVKGFLTRRLLRTERVAQLVRTVRDTRQFLQAMNPGGRELCSRQDILLQERVALQLCAARYEVSDIFFGLSAAERMQIISWDREVVREREHRRQSGHAGQPGQKSALSAATQKSLERKKEKMMQKKAVGRHRGVLARNGHNAGFSAEQPQETKRGQFKANPQRVPKSTYSSRPR